MLISSTERPRSISPARQDPAFLFSSNIDADQHVPNIPNAEVDVVRETSPYTDIGMLILAHSNKVYTFTSQFLCDTLKESTLKHLDRVLHLPHSNSPCILPGLTDAIHHIYYKTQKLKSASEPAQDMLHTI